MQFVSAVRRGTGKQGPLVKTGIRRAAPLCLVLVCLLAAGVVTSRQADWQPLSLAVALGASMMVADVMAVSARRVRISVGLTVQVVSMALLGPAPAAAIGVAAAIADGLVNPVRPMATLNNMAIFGFLGLAGGILFDVLGAWFGLDPRDTAYALLIPPVYFLLAGVNLGLVATTSPGLEGIDPLRVLRESGLPPLPVELLNALAAAAVVLVWAHAGLAAAAALLVLLVITVPLLRVISSALKSGDDLLALRHVSDERAAEVARLASDRERLLSEVLQAEERERARLAEALHDGPMQRLIALRQDAAEASEGMSGGLDVAIAETRALISAFHPATVREMGFEASLRAAVSPFPAAQSIDLTISSDVDDRYLADTILLPVAQELVVNAVKHAAPSTIDVSVRAHGGPVVMQVSDDGVGIDTSDAGRAVQAGHLGLAMVRRRVEDAGGVLDIETRSDGGTRSRVTLPLALPERTCLFSEPRPQSPP
jgi:two-component system, NarL family, sensor kinase